MLCNHPLWKDDGNKGLQEALDALERYGTVLLALIAYIYVAYHDF